MENAVYISDRREWRGWLADNHDKADEVWLIYYKKQTLKPTLTYDESINEAICFGWVDVLLKKIDEERYCRRFVPRRLGGQWSANSVRRAEAMIDAGLMAEPGWRIIEAAKKRGSWYEDAKPEMPLEPPPELRQLLDEFPDAREFYESLAPSHKKQYNGWIGDAKRKETRLKRALEALAMLRDRSKSGMF